MLVCSYCRHGNPDTSRFCAQCGTRLGAPTERREERKTISVLFVDLVGFTGRAERMDVEDVQAMLDPYYELVRGELEQRGGTVEKYIGDAVVAFFGVPVAHEDDPERAVRAALAIREALAAANEHNAELDLHIRIGVTTGEVLVALDVSPATGETFASGDVVNTAARLQGAAPIDGVLVADATYRATRTEIEYRAAPAVVAKGKAEPVPCWTALHARSRVGESSRRRDSAPLIDRRRETRLLGDALDLTRTTRAVRSMTLIGVPGIGKSRLVRELFRRIDGQPELIRWREGRSPPYGEGVTFRALGDIVKAEAGVLDTHERGAASEKLRTRVVDLIDDRDEAEWVERHLRTLVGLASGADLLGDRRAEAFAAWRRFIERLAQRNPTVLVFEDLHWADDALLDFIEHLIAWSESVPLLVLCTARAELLDRRPGWGRMDDGANIVALGPLSQAETHDLLDALVAPHGLSDATRRHLMAAAEGNPLYAQEFVRMLIDQGVMVERDGDWVLDRAERLPVPDSVSGIIAARIDAVPWEDKAVIQDAAVVGRTFWPGALASISDRDPGEIAAALERLVRRHLVRRRHDSAVAGDDEYAFEHALMRDVAYRSIVRAQRADKHRRAAEWLASLTGDARDRADAVAHHYVTAFENARACGQETGALRVAAVDALRAAAERAASVHAHVRAARQWRRALDLAPAGDARRPRLLLGCGEALALADEPATDVLEEAVRALEAAGDPGGTAEAESVLAWLHSVGGAPAIARAHDARALALARDEPESAAKAAILTRAAANLTFLGGRREEALGLLHEAIAIARRLRLREMEAEALQFVGMVRLDAGDEAGVRDLESALAVATELNSPASLTCYGNLAEMRRYLGSLDASAALHRDGERAARRFGIPVQVRRFRGGQACDLYYTGDWDAALANVAEYLDAVEAGSPHRLAGEARLHRGRIRLARGDDTGALEDAAGALAFARLTGDPFDLFPALAFHARASMATDAGAAEAFLADLCDGLAEGQPLWGAWALGDVIPVLRRHPRADELARLLSAAAPPTPWYDALVASLRGDHLRAAAVYAAIGSRPDEALARLRAADAALAAGDRAAAATQLDAARVFFEQVGAHAHLRDVEALKQALAAPPVATPAAAPSRRSAR